MQVIFTIFLSPFLTRYRVLGHCHDCPWARYSSAIHRRCLDLHWLRRFRRHPRVSARLVALNLRWTLLFPRIGPVDLTLGTLSPDTNTLIPTVTDNLFSQQSIPSDIVSVSFEPTTTTSVKNGELTFGGTDSTKFTGSITTM